MERKRMPSTRHSMTSKGAVGGHEFYVNVGFYDDDPTQPGEVFITIAKEGSTMSGLCDALGVTISLALQFGVPWEDLAKKYEHTRFEPSDASNSSLIHGIAATITDVINHRRSTWDE